MERKRRHDITKTTRVCDYCDRVASASSWQMTRWVHRCMGCFAAYYRARVTP